MKATIAADALAREQKLVDEIAKLAAENAQLKTKAPEHAKMVVVAKPQPVVAPSDQVDCLSQMIMLGQQQKLPGMKTIN